MIRVVERVVVERYRYIYIYGIYIYIYILYQIIYLVERVVDKCRRNLALLRGLGVGQFRGFEGFNELNLVIAGSLGWYTLTKNFRYPKRRY